MKRTTTSQLWELFKKPEIKIWSFQSGVVIAVQFTTLSYKEISNQPGIFKVHWLIDGKSFPSFQGFLKVAS